MPGTFVSSASKTSIRRKFRELEIHKRRQPIAHLARALNPVIEGIIQYYHKNWHAGMRLVWNQLNHSLLKWVKWEKGIFKYASLRLMRAMQRTALYICSLEICITITIFSQVDMNMKSQMN
jgi:hypothetical protein